MSTKYAEISVSLIGQDGNAFAILGRVIYAMKQADISDIEITQFHEEATSGDYDNLIATVMRWVDVY